MHLISTSRNQGPRERPNIIFYLSYLCESSNCGIVTDPTDLHDMYASINFTMANVSQEFLDFARDVFRGKQIPFPDKNGADALRMYT